MRLPKRLLVRGSIRLKILAPLFLAGIVLMIAAQMFLGRTAARQLNDRLLQRAQATARALAQAAECVSDVGDLRRLVHASGAEADIESIVIAAGNPTKIIACTQLEFMDGGLDEIKEEDVARSLRVVLASGRERSEYADGESHMAFATPMRSASTSGLGFENGAVVVQVNARSTIETVREWTRATSIFILSSIALAIVTAALLVTRYVNRPIAAITAAIRARAHGDQTSDAPIVGNDEIGGLAHALNRANAATDRASREAAMLHRALDLSAMVSVTDADGRIITANENFIAVSGYSRQELLGQTHRIVRSGEHSTEFFAEMWSRIKSGRLWRGEIKNRRKDGSYYWIDSTIVPTIGADGRIEKFTSIRFDITTRKNAEAALIAARDQADAANTAKSDFLATMSHEIRTPMNGIIGFSEILLDTELTDEQCRGVTTIARSAGSLLAIINDILDFSKIEAGKMRVDSAPFSASREVENVVALLAVDAQKKGLTLDVDWQCDCPKEIVGDATRFRQVVLNLTSNAVKFTSSGGVHIRACNGRIGTIRIEIEDSGIGMTPETCARLFTKFMQADSSMTRRFGGTGLGLAISKQLVALMGGQIGVRSAVGYGSTFFIELPLSTADRTTKSANASIETIGAVENEPVATRPTPTEELATSLPRWAE